MKEKKRMGYMKIMAKSWKNPTKLFFLFNNFLFSGALIIWFPWDHLDIRARDDSLWLSSDQTTHHHIITRHKSTKFPILLWHPRQKLFSQFKWSQKVSIFKVLPPTDVRHTSTLQYINSIFICGYLTYTLG
mgnify:CR=1 FL=1